MKRKLAWVCLLVSPLVIGGAAICFLGGDSITEDNCAKIKKGMTQSDVERILNAKPEENGWCKIWFGDDSLIFVCFDENQLVTGKGYKASLPENLRRPTFFDKLRKWLLPVPNPAPISQEP